MLYEQHKDVTDERMIEMLVTKGEMELEETLLQVQQNKKGNHNKPRQHFAHQCSPSYCSTLASEPQYKQRSHVFTLLDQTHLLGKEEYGAEPEPFSGETFLDQDFKERTQPVIEKLQKLV